ncbi:hypothetical protein HDU67_008353, partial [Dinochytrium kinnereticum]
MEQVSDEGNSGAKWSPTPSALAAGVGRNYEGGSGVDGSLMPLPFHPPTSHGDEEPDGTGGSLGGRTIEEGLGRVGINPPFRSNVENVDPAVDEMGEQQIHHSGHPVGSASVPPFRFEAFCEKRNLIVDHPPSPSFFTAVSSFFAGSPSRPALRSSASSSALVSTSCECSTFSPSLSRNDNGKSLELEPADGLGGLVKNATPTSPGALKRVGSWLKLDRVIGGSNPSSPRGGRGSIGDGFIVAKGSTDGVAGSGSFALVADLGRGDSSEGGSPCNHTDNELNDAAKELGNSSEPRRVSGAVKLKRSRMVTKTGRGFFSSTFLASPPPNDVVMPDKEGRELRTSSRSSTTPSPGLIADPSPKGSFDSMGSYGQGYGYGLQGHHGAKGGHSVGFLHGKFAANAPAANYIAKNRAPSTVASTSNQSSHSSFGTRDSQGGFVYRVLSMFRPGLPDEIELERGDLVSVYSIFEDSWAYGLNVTSGKMGMFPLNAVRRQSYRSASNLKHDAASVRSGFGGPPSIASSFSFAYPSSGRYSFSSTGTTPSAAAKLATILRTQPRSLSLGFVMPHLQQQQQQHHQQPFPSVPSDTSIPEDPSIQAALNLVNSSQGPGGDMALSVPSQPAGNVQVPSSAADTSILAELHLYPFPPPPASSAASMVGLMVPGAVPAGTLDRSRRSSGASTFMEWENRDDDEDDDEEDGEEDEWIVEKEGET